MVPQNFFSALRASVWSKNKGGRGRAPHWIRCCISLFISPRNRLGCTDWAAAPGNEVDRWYIIILINLRIDYLFPASPKYGKSVGYEVIAEEMEPTRKKAKYFEWIRSIINFRLSLTVELHCYKRNIFIAHFFFSRRFNFQYYYSVCDCYGRFLCYMPRYHCLPEVKASSKTKGVSTTGSRQRDVHLDAMFLLPNALCLWLHFWNLIKNV